MKGNGGICTGHLRSSVFSDVDLNEGVNVFFDLIKDLIGRNMSGIDPSLPMVEFDLISEMEKEVDVIG